MKKTIIYLRTSTNTQSGSIEDQRFICSKYANDNGLINFEIVVDMVSGAKDNRDGYNYIINQVKVGNVENVIVSKIDRLARKISFVCNALELFKKHNVRLISVKENIDTTNAQSLMMVHMLSMCAEFERSQIVERVNSTKKYLYRNNRVAGNVKYGFSSVNKTLCENKEEMAIVNTIVSLHNAGNNYSQISRIMNRNNFRTRSNGLFYPQTVKNIIVSHVA